MEEQPRCTSPEAVKPVHTSTSELTPTEHNTQGSERRNRSQRSLRREDISQMCAFTHTRPAIVEGAQPSAQDQSKQKRVPIGRVGKYAQAAYRRSGHRTGLSSASGEEEQDGSSRERGQGQPHYNRGHYNTNSGGWGGPPLYGGHSSPDYPPPFGYPHMFPFPPSMMVEGYIALVENIPLKTTTTQLFEHFSPHGEILDIERRNFDAYIFYSTPVAADVAAQVANGTLIHGSKLKVSRGGTMYTFVQPEYALGVPPTGEHSIV